MKILHAAALLENSSGIYEQMMWEQVAANTLKLNWKTFIFCPSGNTADSEIKKYSKKINLHGVSGKRWSISEQLIFSSEYYKWLKSYEADVDIFLLRYRTYDFFQLIFIFFCKKPVYLIHHTLELPELLVDAGFSNKIKYFIEKIVGKYSIKYSFCTVGVTAEIINYEKHRSNLEIKNSIIYPNGILYVGKKLYDNREVVPEFLFVASFFSAWHGLDLLISEISKSKQNFLIHIVGNVSALDKNIGLKDARLIFHGQKNSDEIRSIASRCWLGFGSFALSRKEMKEACTLKVREYLMMGLPVYSGHKDVFPDNFEYYKFAELNIQDILEYAAKIRSISRELVSEEAKKYIDKIEVLNLLNEQINLLIK